MVGIGGNDVIDGSLGGETRTSSASQNALLIVGVLPLELSGGAMCKILPCLIAACLIACMARPLHGQSVIVVGDFTGGANGWTGQTGVSSTTSFSGALRVQNLTLILIEGGILLDGFARPMLGAEMIALSLLKADVRWIAADWLDDTLLDPTDNWSRWDDAEVRTGGLTQSFPVSHDPVAPGAPGRWDLDVLGDHSRTLTWDLSSLALDTSGPVELWLKFSMATTAALGGGVLWVDRVWLEAIPEPTSGALGVGLIVVVMAQARRRRTSRS